jgi:hypothetical protein
VLATEHAQHRLGQLKDDLRGVGADVDGDIAMVFQNYALYPHMTVEDNLAFGLQLRKTPKDEVEAEELAGEGQSLWTARVNPKTQAKVGRSVDLAVDTSGFHFFDADTGLAIGHPDTTNGSRSTAARTV